MNKSKLKAMAAELVKKSEQAARRGKPFLGTHGRKVRQCAHEHPALHARAVGFLNGKPSGRLLGKPMCGANSLHTTDDKWVTCVRCLRLVEHHNKMQGES